MDAIFIIPAIFGLPEALLGFRGQVVVVVLGTLGALWGLYRVYCVMWSRPSYLLEPDVAFLDKLRSVDVSPELAGDGYRVLESRGGREHVLRSNAVDTMLRQSAIILRHRPSRRERVAEVLRGRSDDLEIALRAQYWRSAGSQPRKEFIDEAKLCLASELRPGLHSAEVSRGSYFEAFLSNELFCQQIVSDGPRPRLRYSGSSYPCALDSRDGTRMHNLDDSLMTNNIGMSTLAHTSDGYFIFWRQSGRAQHSVNLLAPTGSGSCDFADWHPGDSLQATLARAMERELGEESNFKRHRVHVDHIEGTRVIGYYRWVERGGKPEFVGVSKVRVHSEVPTPNANEVDAPEGGQFRWPARSYAEMMGAIEEQLSNPALSTPLELSLIALRDAIGAERGRWMAFFRIS